MKYFRHPAVASLIGIFFFGMMVMCFGSLFCGCVPVPPEEDDFDFVELRWVAYEHRCKDQGIETITNNVEQGFVGIIGYTYNSDKDEYDGFDEFVTNGITVVGSGLNARCEGPEYYISVVLAYPY